MKYVIYGINRVARDFLFMFPKIDIVGFTDDSCNRDIYKGKRVIAFDDVFSGEKNYDQIIICGLDKDDKAKKLNSIGLEYNTDYVYADDFFASLDDGEEPFNPHGNKVIIWGTGYNSYYFSDHFKYFNPHFYVDTYKAGGTFFDKKIVSPEEIDNWNDYYVIVAVQRDEEIVEYLNNHGLKEDVDYVNYYKIVSRPSEMLRATIYDKHQYNLNCDTPLNHMEYLTDGKIFCCCSTFMRSIGDSSQNGITAVWRAVKHKIVCLSVQNHTYTFCEKRLCPLLFGKETKGNTVSEDKQLKEMRDFPEVSAIGFDYTCNLKCETCRSSMRVACGEEKNRMLNMAKLVEKEILPKSRFFVMAGDGEVFASEAYKHIYKSENMNNVEFIRILSNGTLFNEKNWEEFKKNKTGKVMLTASVDAATKETYEKIRINGNFDILKKNMEFAGRLRREGELAYFRMNYVVQRRNYAEMPDFVKWGLEIGADEVFFTKMLNWGTFTKEEFREVSMFEDDGVTPKPEMKEILNDPIMKEEIVDLGTIMYNHETIEDRNIHNYYMWELERKVPGLFTK